MGNAIHRPQEENVPRYTSYPTAPHFHDGVGNAELITWLNSVTRGEAIGLYLHIPFCDQVCWFCACNTKHTTRYHVVETYVKSLLAEISQIGKLLINRPRVHFIHYGGGSPTMLRPDDLMIVDTALRDAFDVGPDVQISFEIDPRDMDEERYRMLGAIGTTRASIGVQDFDRKVQTAINRHQGFEMTRQVVTSVRKHGITSVNLDLLYGLPHQTVDSIRSTIDQALTLQPDRIALFGYAHVPWFKKQQTMIKDAWLPTPKERFLQSMAARDLIIDRGYEAIGLDHFSLPPDDLSLARRTGKLRRNFQGYTADLATTLVGLGASSISRFKEGYIQNMTAAAAYERQIAVDGLAVAKGFAFTPDDRIRGWVIEKLMCDFEFSAYEAYGEFGNAAKPILEEARRIVDESDGAQISWELDTFRIAIDARPFVRSIAAHFDKFLAGSQARHSLAV